MMGLTQSGFLWAWCSGLSKLTSPLSVQLCSICFGVRSLYSQMLIVPPHNGPTCFYPEKTQADKPSLLLRHCVTLTYTHAWMSNSVFVFSGSFEAESPAQTESLQGSSASSERRKPSIKKWYHFKRHKNTAVLALRCDTLMQPTVDHLQDCP